MSASSDLATFAVTQSRKTLPPNVRARAQSCLDLVLGRAARAATTPVVLRARAVLGNSKGNALVLGGGARIASEHAAFVNAAGATDQGADSADAVIVAAAVALAEERDVTIETLTDAVAVGLEVRERVACALGSAHVERGFSLTGTAARIGATAAGAHVVGLSAKAMLDAFGFASTCAAGLQSSAGEIPALLAGLAAQDSVESVLMAEVGLYGPPLPLEGRRGLLALESSAADASQLNDGLGEVWRADQGQIAVSQNAAFAESLLELITTARQIG